MTERSVKRFMLGAAISAATILTTLAVAGLVITSRGPQAQALPLARTAIADAFAAEVTADAPPLDTMADRPQHNASSQLPTSTTDALVVAEFEATQTSTDFRTSSNAGTSYRSSRPSQPSGTSSPSYPPFSGPPTTVRVPPTPGGTTPAPTSGDPSASPGRTLTSDGTTKDARESTAKTRAAASTTPAPATTTTSVVGRPVQTADADHTHEVVQPGLRESDNDTHGD